MTSSLSHPQVTELLATLYADAASKDPQAHQAAANREPEIHFFHAMRHAYMAIGPAFGHLLYSLVRTSKARTIVEFGTSFGVSTIYLAAAIRDNGGGKVITTEFEPEKVAKAKANLTAAGLVQFVDFRVGDALQTLAGQSENVDLLFLDGAKHLYIEVLNLLEPHLPSGAIVASDNADHEEMASFLAYLRDPQNGYTSSAIFTDGVGGKAHEITVRN